MPFDLEFEVACTSFWAWRGVVEDRQAALRAVLCRPYASIAVVFKAWRYAVSTDACATSGPSQAGQSG